MSTTWSAALRAKVGARRSVPDSIRLPEFSAFAKWLPKEWEARSYHGRWGKLFTNGAGSARAPALGHQRVKTVAGLAPERAVVGGDPAVVAQPGEQQLPVELALDRKSVV